MTIPGQGSERQRMIMTNNGSEEDLLYKNRKYLYKRKDYDRTRTERVWYEYSTAGAKCLPVLFGVV